MQSVGRALHPGGEGVQAFPPASFFYSAGPSRGRAGHTVVLTIRKPISVSPHTLSGFPHARTCRKPEWIFIRGVIRRNQPEINLGFLWGCCMSCPGCPDCWAFTSTPVQITEKLRKTAFYPVFGSAVSPQDATKRNRDAGNYRFPGSISGFLKHRCENRLF